MSFKEFLVLFFLFIFYLFLGAYMFYKIERPLEEESRRLEREARVEIQELLQQHYEKGVARAQEEILERLNEYCGKPFSFSTFNHTNGTSRVVKDTVEEKPFLWSFYNSLLFVICTLSTIGYGNLAPKSRHGRILDVVYGLIGIPFNGIVMLQMAEYFGSVFVKAQSRHKEKEKSGFTLFLDICRYLIPGIVIFFLFPAGMFVYFEDWYFDTGIYYAFVTLTTIGYGDLVAGQNNSEALEYQIFKVMVLVWILFGLGYMVMIVTMITRAMRSKKVRRIEQKLAYTIKQTQNKIWSEFTQDLTYVRRMLNEMYLLKFQPIYKDELISNRLLDSKNRSQSAPNLTEWPVLRKKEIISSSEDEEDIEKAFTKHKMNRRRAYSENVMTPQVTRVMSEGDLSKIDRNATFGAVGGNIEPGALLARVVDALGTPIGSRFSSSDEEDEVTSKYSNRRLSGIHGFSDAEILASENQTRWPSMGKRTRALSESTPPFKRFSMNEEQRTWSGVNHQDIHNFVKMRENGSFKHMDSKSLKSSKSSIDEQLQPPPSGLRRMSMAAINFFNPSSKSKPVDRKDSKKKRRTGNPQSLYPSMQTGQRLSLQEDDQPESMLEQINYLSHTSGRRASIFNALTSELAPKSDGSIPISPILEQTSVADFIRLISSLQTRLDPTAPLTQDSLTSISKRQSVASLSKDSPLSALFVQRPPNAKTDSTPGSRETISTPQAILRRRLSVNPQAQSLRPGLSGERRFSLIPPMDVDHPSGQRKSLYENFNLRKRSISQNPLNDVKPAVAPHQRLRRLSLAGSARYISSKNQNREGTRIGKKATPTLPSVVVSNPQGRRKFSVRPVESATSQVSGTSRTPAPAPTPPPPKITIDPVADEEPDQNNRKMSTDSLEDVVIVRL